MIPERLAVYVLIGVVVLALFAVRLRRLQRARPLKVERLWIIPALYVALVGYLLVQTPPASGRGWAWCAAALAVGAGAGWLRGRTMRVVVDPVTHAVSQAASPAATLFIIALVLARSALRSVFAEGDSAVGLSQAGVLDALACLALGLLSVQRLEMGLRARRLLAAAKGDVAGRGPV